MKKYIILLPIVALLLSACKHDEPNAKYAVTFKLPQVSVNTEPMDNPRKAPILTDDDGKQMTDLILFDGSTYLLRQQSTDPEFGTITVMLTAGTHNLHFIATRSEGLDYTDGMLTCTSLKPTFGDHYTINVSSSSDEYVTMERITGQVVVIIEDEIPADAKSLRIQFGDFYTSIDPTTFNATRTGAYDTSVDISGKAGKSGQSFTINILAPNYGVEHTTSFTLTAKNTSGTIIGQATGTMPICSNTKTLLHGNLFTGTRSFISLSTAWNADKDASF